MAAVKEKEVEIVVVESPEHVSESGRTLVRVDMDEDGSFRLYVDRDGHRVHDFSMNYEQPGTDGEPKAPVN